LQPSHKHYAGEKVQAARRWCQGSSQLTAALRGRSGCGQWVAAV